MLHQRSVRLDLQFDDLNQIIARFFCSNFIRMIDRDADECQVAEALTDGFCRMTANPEVTERSAKLPDCRQSTHEPMTG